MANLYDLDSTAIRRAFDKAATTYDQAAVLSHEVRDRLLERLNLVRGAPEVVLDLGAGTGHASGTLKRRFPSARIVAVDVSLPMLDTARRQQRIFRKFDRVCGDGARLPLRDESVDWCVSNLMLPWCVPPDAVFAEVRRVLKKDGLFSFTTLGPDTLCELRAAWMTVDAGPHVHRFIDMHDLGDALARSGFAEPVMDVERIALTYPGVMQLMHELKNTGATTATTGRTRGLANRAKLSAVAEAYELLRQQNRLLATFEIVYGQAWRGRLKTHREGDVERRVPLEEVRASLRKRSIN